MAVTTNTGGIIFADSTYQTTAAISGTLSTSLSGSDVTLTSSSPQNIVVGPVQNSDADTVFLILPAATTLANGRSFTITVRDWGDIKVKDGSSNLLCRISAVETQTLTCIDNSSTAGKWISSKDGLLNFGIGLPQTNGVYTVSPRGQTDGTLVPMVGRISDTKFLVIFPQASGTWSAIVGTVSGTTISWGTPTNCPSGYVGGHYNGDSYTAFNGLFLTNNDTMVWAATHASSGQKYFIPISISGTTVSFPSGSLYIGTGGSWADIKIVSSRSWLASYYNNDGYFYCSLFSINGGTTISAGTGNIQTTYKPQSIFYASSSTGSNRNYAMLVTTPNPGGGGTWLTWLYTFELTTSDGSTFTTLTNVTAQISSNTNYSPFAGVYTKVFRGDYTADYPVIISLPEPDYGSSPQMMEILPTTYCQLNFSGRTYNSFTRKTIENRDQITTSHVFQAAWLGEFDTSNGYVFGSPNGYFYTINPMGNTGNAIIKRIGKAPATYQITALSSGNSLGTSQQARRHGSVTVALTSTKCVSVGSSWSSNDNYLSALVITKYW